MESKGDLTFVKLSLEEKVSKQAARIAELEAELELERKRFPKYRRPQSMRDMHLFPEKDQKEMLKSWSEEFSRLPALLKYMERVEQTRELPLGAGWLKPREKVGAALRIQTMVRGRKARRRIKDMRWVNYVATWDE
jgi:hypothetical protein